MQHINTHSNIIPNLFFEKKKFTQKSCYTCYTDKKDSIINAFRSILCNIDQCYTVLQCYNFPSARAYFGFFYGMYVGKNLLWKKVV